MARLNISNVKQHLLLFKYPKQEKKCKNLYIKELEFLGYYSIQYCKINIKEKDTWHDSKLYLNSELIGNNSLPVYL